jgi:hypothetical protein
MATTTFDRAAARLHAVRYADGFGPSAGLAPEPEPTALAALALDDADARAWLEEHQRADGGFELLAGHQVTNDAATALAALALAPGGARERALDHLVTNQAQATSASPEVPHDPNTRGWGWTPDTFGWVEPTSRAVLALQLLRPSAAAEIDDGLAVLADRECPGGGWNYGNGIVYDTPLPPYAQTTASALIGLQGALPDLHERGMTTLARLWSEERAGGLSLAVSLAAFRLGGRPEAAAVEQALADELERTDLLGDVVALAWTALAAGPGLEHLRRAGA